MMIDKMDYIFAIAKEQNLTREAAVRRAVHADDVSQPRGKGAGLKAV